MLNTTNKRGKTFQKYSDKLKGFPTAITKDYE